VTDLLIAVMASLAMVVGGLGVLGYFERRKRD